MLVTLNKEYFNLHLIICSMYHVENIGEVEMSVLEHPAMTRELEDAKNGHSALKHLKQQV